jgi:short-subunit dehydrogenase
MPSSKNKRALITGASSGIGRATALAFAQAGISLALVSRSQDKLDAVATEARGSGVEVTVHPLDLADLSQVKGAITQINDQFGPIEILVNNAGMGYTNSLLDSSLEDWQRVLDLNLTSVLQCIQAVLPTMRQHQNGLIINVASIAAYQTFSDWGAYSVSKAGLLALSRVLRIEEQAHGIRVAVIAPGPVDTPIWETDMVQADFDRSQMLTSETVAQLILQVALLPKGAVVEELTLMPSGGAL